MNAWLESEAIERALDAHTCNVERAFIYHGREYLFNTRMCISYDYQRFIPHVVTGLNRKSEEWLRDQGRRAKISALSLHEVSGNPQHTLAQRPHFVWWFMAQARRALQLWNLDHSLTIALDVFKEFTVPINFLADIFPCNEQREHYAELQQYFATSCSEAHVGISYAAG